MHASLRLHLALGPLAALGLGLLSAQAAHQAQPPAESAVHLHSAPEQLFEVVKIVDGDTLHVLRDGVKEKLRLLSVDTEEKLSGNPNASPTKPETVFGEESAAWAQSWIPEHATIDGRVLVGLAFPGGIEQRDIYGRLLCHVLLPDGTDFNVELVRLGKSPYFNKYGESLICQEAFLSAQSEAKEANLGIWNPATNRPADSNTPAVVRPYERLIPWWQARADAVTAFRQRAAENPIRDVAADDPSGLELAAYASDAGARVSVFGSIQRIFVEDDGDWTLLMRSGDRDRSVRGRIQAEDLKHFDTADLERRATEEFCQNYLILEGPLGRGSRGFDIDLRNPEQVRAAGPEPNAP